MKSGYLETPMTSCLFTERGNAAVPELRLPSEDVDLEQIKIPFITCLYVGIFQLWMWFALTSLERSGWPILVWYLYYRIEFRSEVRREDLRCTHLQTRRHPSNILFLSVWNLSDYLIPGMRQIHKCRYIKRRSSKAVFLFSLCFWWLELWFDNQSIQDQNNGVNSCSEIIHTGSYLSDCLIPIIHRPSHIELNWRLFCCKTFSLASEEAAATLKN